MRVTARIAACAALLGLGLPGFARAGVDEGKALYDKQCKVCHSIAGDAGKMADKGGPLDGVGSKRDAAWLEDVILADPKAAMPEAKMPKMKLDEHQIEDLIAYMLTLKAAPPGRPHAWSRRTRSCRRRHDRPPLPPRPFSSAPELAGRALAPALRHRRPAGAGLGLGATTVMEDAKRPNFCGSCHVMHPFVNDLKDPASTTLAPRTSRTATSSRISATPATPTTDRSGRCRRSSTASGTSGSTRPEPTRSDPARPPIGVPTVSTVTGKPRRSFESSTRTCAAQLDARRRRLSRLPRARPSADARHDREAQRDPALATALGGVALVLMPSRSRRRRRGRSASLLGLGFPSHIRRRSLWRVRLPGPARAPAL